MKLYSEKIIQGDCAQKVYRFPLKINILTTHKETNSLQPFVCKTCICFMVAKSYIYIYNTYSILYMHNKHILYARRGIKATPIPQKCYYPHSNIPGSVFAVVHHVIYVNQASGRDFFHNVKRMFLFFYDKWNKLLRNISLLCYNYKKKINKK